MQQPLTSQWDSRNGKGYAYNTDISLVPFARTVTGDAPDQITITYQVIPDDESAPDSCRTVLLSLLLHVLRHIYHRTIENLLPCYDSSGFKRTSIAAKSQYLSEFIMQSPTSLVINWVVGDGQSYNSTTTITKPSTAGVQSIVQYAAKGATSELNATG